MERRGGAFKRETAETNVKVQIALEGEGKFSGTTGLKFLDHMLTLLAYHSFMDLTVEANWDLKHHGVEDVAITLGQALSEALGDRERIARFGYALVPMDEALAEVAVDLAKRPHAAVNLGLSTPGVEDLAAEDILHFFQSLATTIPAAIHINVRYGLNDHHKVEAAVKALAIALRNAWQREPRRKGPPSSKGAV
ncbi:MAG: imidazoleglycerol-phosphate dehydratase [Nitrososphaerota archaeon]|nr:imidazoleglycerol-phosphate dehydratase [Candidatus Calditenuaceae archaeon]MDW8073098.1 imidazoleglycerol-phosphate dehydratase [Nitrososphaerota archaeon]